MAKQTRIQTKNQATILDAALDVFSTHGFRGSTVDQIANAAGMSKPNLLYYFPTKGAIHQRLLSELLTTWLDPLIEMKADGDPLEEIMGYVNRKLEMSRKFPRESRLFANEILQGAPRIQDALNGELKALVDEKRTIIQDWMDAGKIARVPVYHLIFSIWSLTQHYADFDVQIRAVRGGDVDPFDGSDRFLELLYERLLRPDGTSQP
ncbi:TetR family transcriptional regulator C-terminal domain-containing protein [Thalassobium sp. R2A62]|jgi:TetR/AcrR family transcriptional regulator|uniref:TetR family transcriptional regulator C-terminal domain-containing protein n=1 Tax=Thalassobium sp. R2A62 TaxID=633131 RepID=UPI0001B1D09A|nr:TetR family transcriptional regulator C-terminal domain-containing protein [Thalassobium sp. R2A62]EET46803.1 transcriptional regulator, TetR family [Thalassobium sp. R2A62]MDG1339601.1 TetR family transcriptional regulator C-terminal domain-containing protein [Paracoccaceae bacterium]MDG1803205.1 TetR family transcriptional regulator C-terminal domain-containing protein [Paracoccaceae bacterium]MDG2453976.1 TetR family transcriptional regulator C-terminal domain-containing protein [Paracocc